jgi:murein L,D-transpeptidase YafK
MDSPKIVMKKSERMLYVYDGDELCAKMTIVLGSAPEGHKQVEGDGKTPEGSYYICTRNSKSKFYLSLGISYPNKQDAKSGLERGTISQSDYERIASAIDAGKRPPWDTKLGGEIMIHAGGVSSDWTAGCIAAQEADIDYLWENCPIGTPVEILP